MKQGARNRERIIIQTSIIGILTNIVLAAVKAAIGLAAHSIAVLTDAVNNLSDALSSVVTIIGTHLASRPADKKHPLGHGRIEYMSAMVVSVIVLYAGVTATVDAVKKILQPTELDYSALSLILLALAVVAKLVLGAYTAKRGREVNSGSLVASGQDARNDALLSSSVLAAALLYFFFDIRIEAYVGALLGIYIIYSGLQLVREAVDDIVGVRVSGELSGAVRQLIAKEPEVRGVYDMLLNNYGPDRYIASAHIEVEDRMTAKEIDALTRKVQAAVYEETGVILGALGIYSANTSDDRAEQMRDTVRRIIFTHEGALQFHGFYLDEEQKILTFDIILDFAVEDRASLYQHIKEEVQEAFPDYRVQVTLDVDVSD